MSGAFDFDSFLVIRLPNLISLNVCFRLPNYGYKNARLCRFVVSVVVMFFYHNKSEFESIVLFVCVLCCLPRGLTYLLWAFLCSYANNLT